MWRRGRTKSEQNVDAMEVLNPARGTACVALNRLQHFYVYLRPTPFKYARSRHTTRACLTHTLHYSPHRDSHPVLYFSLALLL